MNGIKTLRTKSKDNGLTWCFAASLILASVFALGVNQLKADYIYEGNQPLYDLQTNSSGSTGLGSNDDSVSPAFDLGFTFTFYGNDYTQARMATNGCLHFNLTGSYCGDYTPDPLPQYTNTLFPFWTDLIKDNGSAMRAKAFDDYTIFGWYKMREYNRANSDNSIEVWLYPNDTYEFRYGELDIISHDVLIGEQGSTSQIYTYHFFDECNTGTTNVSGTCVSYDWNSSSNAVNTLLEDGGSLYGDGTDQSLCATVPLTSVNCSGYAAAYFTQQCNLSALYDEDCTGYAAAYLAQQCGLSALYDSSCTGYAAAYLAQQCGLNDLYSSSCEGYAVAYLAQQCGLNDLYDSTCPNYDSAYRIQQCDEDAQYSPTCNGYVQDTVVTYYVEDIIDYGYVEDTWIDDDPYADMYFTDVEWYEIDIMEFGQEQVDEWYGTEVSFDSGGYIVWDDTPLETWDDLDQQMDIYDDFVETYEFTEEVYLVSYDEFEPNPLPFDTSEELIEEFVFHETVLVEDYENLETYIEFETIEELDEWYEEELAQLEEEEIFEEELVAEIEERLEEPEEEFIEEVFEEEVVEEIFEEIEEERIAEAEEEILEERLAEEEKEEKKGGITAAQLNVVASTIQTASNSVSGTTAGVTSRTSGWGSSASGTAGGTSSGFSGGSGGSVVTSTAGNTTTTAVASSASGGAFSTSSSPSISDQIQTAQVQTNTVLSLNQDMGSTSGMGGSTQTVSNVTTVITPMPTFDSTPQIVMADVQVTDMQGEIDTAIGGVMTASEADQIADQIVADNIKEQQEAGQTTQEETGKYGDESTLVAFLGYVPGFDAYREATIPKQETWYEPRAIYADASISDNISAFYGLASSNINKMQSIISSQPNL